MKKLSLAFNFIIISALFSGCSVVEGIFKAGFWTGLLLVAVIVIALVIFFANIYKKNNN